MFGRDIDWRGSFADFDDRPEAAALLDAAAVVTLDAGQMVFDKGSPCRAFLLVLEGVVCVHLLGESGRLITLYRVRPGQSCVLTTTCLLGDQAYPAIGVTEAPVRALQLGKRAFREGLDTSSGFRDFVFSGLGQRLTEVIRRMDEVSLATIDVRLARVLQSASADNPVLRLTHETLAVELGTAREVVSRHLKRFEHAGWLALRRGEIEIIDAAAIDAIGCGDVV